MAPRETVPPSDIRSWDVAISAESALTDASPSQYARRQRGMTPGLDRRPAAAFQRCSEVPLNIDNTRACPRIVYRRVDMPRLSTSPPTSHWIARTARTLPIRCMNLPPLAPLLLCSIDSTISAASRSGMAHVRPVAAYRVQTTRPSSWHLRRRAGVLRPQRVASTINCLGNQWHHVGVLPAAQCTSFAGLAPSQGKSSRSHKDTALRPGFESSHAD